MEDVKDLYHAAPPLWDWRRGDPVDLISEEQQQTERDYQNYLRRRGITAEEHEREIGEWLDTQD